MEQNERASFELLDEQEPRAGKRPRWLRPELLVTVLLLLAVGGWGGWDWWQQQAALSNVRAGDRYAAARDWDAARAAFLAAGDFDHASARAADAAQKIRDRDATYAAANAETDARTWAAALRDFRHVQDIAPGFRDSAARERQAEQQVYLLALSGTVALRAASAPAADPPGLYLYLANGWNYLPGSDAASQVRSDSSAACLVYDTPGAPGPGMVPTPPSTVRPAGPWGDPGGPAGRRRLMVAQYGAGPLTARPLAFDLIEFAWFTCDDTGVMGESYAANSGRSLDLRLTYARGVQLYTPSYQAYTSAAITRVPLRSPAWAILAGDSHMHLVIGDYTNVLGYNPETRLYSSDPQGRLMLVAERQAIVQAAWLSPDGRYLLVDEFIPRGAGPEDHRLVLLTTDQSRAPDVLMSTTRRDLLVVGSAWYDAAFIDSGAFAGKLLIERKTYPAGELRLIDPRDPGRIIWTSDLIDYVDRLRILSMSGGMLLPLSSMAATSLPALYVDARGKTTPLALPVRYGDTLVAAKEIDGRLVYVLQNRNGGSGDLLSAVHSIPLPGTTGAGSPAIELGAPGNGPANNGPDPASDAAGWRWSLGPGLLAYTQAGQLAAKTYDGAITLPLEGSVLWLYPLHH